MKGWIEKNCGCASGLQYSVGYEPKECDMCGGAGRYFLRLKSGVMAMYPGGPFLGKLSKQELQEQHNDTGNAANPL